ncbi:hypothetical protein ABIB00_006324 [Bradyrhizobium sp. LB14.3]
MQFAKTDRATIEKTFQNSGLGFRLLKQAALLH